MHISKLGFALALRCPEPPCIKQQSDCGRSQFSALWFLAREVGGDPGDTVDCILVFRV